MKREAGKDESPVDEAEARSTAKLPFCAAPRCVTGNLPPTASAGSLVETMKAPIEAGTLKYRQEEFLVHHKERSAPLAPAGLRYGAANVHTGFFLVPVAERDWPRPGGGLPFAFAVVALGVLAAMLELFAPDQIASDKAAKDKTLFSRSTTFCLAIWAIQASFWRWTHNFGLQGDAHVGDPAKS